MLQTEVNVQTILLRRGVASASQVEEARQLCDARGGTLEDWLIKLGYVTLHEVMAARAEALGVPLLELDLSAIPSAVIELMPECVARENCVFPVAHDRGALMVAMPDPSDQNVIDKLRFILSKDIWPVLAQREQILAAIDRYYGQTEQESVDSMLCEFTDTAIDFTGTATQAVALDESDADLESSDFELGVDENSPRLGGVRRSMVAEVDSVDEMLLEESDDKDSEFELTLDDMPSAPRSVARPALAHCLRHKASSPLVQRHATVRYYYRMNPLRMYPLLVVISKKVVQEIEKKNVTQKRSQNFEVKLDSHVEIEPILPGCQCYPPKEQVTIGRGEVTARFHVVPHVLGSVDQARIVIRQNGQVLAEVPLELGVVKPGLTVLMGAMSFVLPFGLLLLKHFNLDFESQAAHNFALYAQVGSWAVQSLSPETLTVAMLALTGMVYLWLRPRQRDVFWDVKTADRSGAVASDEPPASSSKPAAVVVEPAQASLLASAESYYRGQEFGRALSYYRAGLLLGRGGASHYHHAALCAFHAGNSQVALGFLKDMEALFEPREIPAAIWFHMGCLLTRLGRHADAVRCLNRAADAGYDDPEEYRNDPDLEALRWRSDFKRLIGSLKR